MNVRVCRYCGTELAASEAVECETYIAMCTLRTAHGAPAASENALLADAVRDWILRTPRVQARRAALRVSR